MPRLAESSRVSKRKANAKPQSDAETDEEDESGFEKMSVHEDEPDAGQETPPRSDPDVTEDEENKVDPRKISRPRSPSGKGKMMETSGAKTPQSQPPGQMTLPPRRDLPFAKQPASGENGNQLSQAASMETSQQDGSSTSDDEL